ncbi:MAG: hypothetical protein A3B70_06785 [Deltaproteobacteria bacterium RIFCSPHIGHO2_02_FULL_40_11]|nr:MAG: hypothetical protein A3B70_06785 [Deltaproteobacteria bacterium RIFCSPHIGHO2_02_FULL_40_11]
MSTLGKKLDFYAFKIVVPLLGIALLGALILGYVAFFPNKFTDVGYAPTQPIAYSHKLHAGDLKISCFYCHGNAEKTHKAGIPSTQVCMNCHSVVKRDSPEVQKIIDSFENNKPIEWVRIHQLPDFVHFKHNVHIQKGVSCFDCHGRVDKMEVVRQEKPLSMGWCFECHRIQNELVKSPRLEDAIERATKDEAFLEQLNHNIENYKGTTWVKGHDRRACVIEHCSYCHY